MNRIDQEVQGDEEPIIRATGSKSAAGQGVDAETGGSRMLQFARIWRYAVSPLHPTGSVC